MVWLWGLSVLTFDTAAEEGVLVRHGSQAMVWIRGDRPRWTEGPFDPSECTLDLGGDGLELRLVSDGLSWSGRAAWTSQGLDEPAGPGALQSPEGDGMTWKQVGVGGVGMALAWLWGHTHPDTGPVLSSPVEQAVPVEASAPVPVVHAAAPAAWPPPGVPARSGGSASPGLPEPAEASEPVEWVAARMMHGPDAPLGAIEGHVVGPDGAVVPGAFVRALGEDGEVHGAQTDVEGRFRFVLPVGRATVSAVRHDAVEVVGDDELVAVQEHEVPYVALELESAPAADAGLTLKVDPRGFEVTAVSPQSGADEAGLSPGSVVLSVGGEAATDLTDETVTRGLVGPVGSTVDVVWAEPDGSVHQAAIGRWPARSL